MNQHAYTTLRDKIQRAWERLAEEDSNNPDSLSGLTKPTLVIEKHRKLSSIFRRQATDKQQCKPHVPCIASPYGLAICGKCWHKVTWTDIETSELRAKHRRRRTTRKER